ncbi:DUF6516 family protein [Brevibacillus centrosporus]|uniref:toxin-antitoxin system TumE family protein n=1 Tax=Brevibacillus centrosporus TaxID=54910 RepID=UPI002E1BBB36|nr:DUF6516 family protein [Brevibacillus centrosporus]
MRKLTIPIPRTTFSNLQRMFPNLFLDVREIPGSEENPRGGREKNAVILFVDNSKLKCKETYDPDSPIKERYEYFYDWYNEDGILLKKFHAHYHPNGTPAEITKYDPWHVHIKLNFADQHGDNRRGVEPGRTIIDVLQEIEGYISIRKFDKRKSEADKTIK